MQVRHMINVKNRKTVYHVADSSFQKNKLRNIVAVIAIILTTILFTGLFTIVGSILNSTEESTMRQIGGKADAGVKNVTLEQYEKLSSHPRVKAASYTVVLGVAENEALVRRQTELRYAKDELAAEALYSLPTTGRLPEKENEIAVDTIVLNYLGIPAELGQQVTMEYTVGNDHYKETFTLAGFWEGDIITPASQVWFSRKYVEGILANYSSSELEGSYAGMICADFFFGNHHKLEKQMVQVIEDCGYSIEEINYGVNWAYIDATMLMDFETIVGGMILICMLMFCGYLIISNIFYISVTKDIRFFGLLKTVGTTGRQIKMLIRRQTLLLCLIGIPLGLAAGAFVGLWLAPIVISTLNEYVVQVELHLWIYVFAAVFSVLTVFLSIRKPAKIASKVSPIEALRVNDGAVSIKKKTRQSRGVRLWNMAWGNVLRNKKKTILVIVSLSLGLIILNMAYSMANAFDMEGYLKDMIDHDFLISDVTWGNVYGVYTNQDTVSDEFLETLKQSPGIEAMENVYFTESFTDIGEEWKDVPDWGRQRGLYGAQLQCIIDDVAAGETIQHLYGIDDGLWKEFTVYEGFIDVEKLKTGDYVVAGAFDCSDEYGLRACYHVGDRVTTISVDGEKKEREVMAVADIPYSISIGESHMTEFNCYLPSEVFLNEVENKQPMVTTLDVEDAYIDEMEQYLTDYMEHVDHALSYKSRQTYKEEYENMQSSYKLVGLVLSAMLALIGIVNFANTSITSVMSRRRELAMLSGIGMTNRQQGWMLIFEGLIYTLFTLVFALAVGTLIGKMGLSMLFGQVSALTIHFNIMPTLLVTPLLILITGGIPFVALKVVGQSSIVERLTEAE